MQTLPTAEWTAALEGMTVALNQTLLNLEHYQAAWATLTDTPATATQPELLLAWLERRLVQWDDRLNTAAELATSVETQLEDREAAVGRWNDVFIRWKELIQRGVDTSSISPG
jgi:hypothetical protein